MFHYECNVVSARNSWWESPGSWEPMQEAGLCNLEAEGPGAVSGGAGLCY